MFVVTVSFEVAPDHVQEFTAAMLLQAENSLAREPGCQVFDVCAAPDNACSVFLYEQYTSPAAFDEHLASEHFKAFDATVSPWVVSKAVSTWSLLGSHS